MGVIYGRHIWEARGNMEAAQIWKQKHEIMHISTLPWALIISANLHAQTLPLVRFGHV